MRFNIKRVRRLWTEASRDRTVIHAEMEDGSIKRAYRVHDSDLAAELTIRRLAREQGMAVREFADYQLEAVRSS